MITEKFVFFEKWFESSQRSASCRFFRLLRGVAKRETGLAAIFELDSTEIKNVTLFGSVRSVFHRLF